MSENKVLAELNNRIILSELENATSQKGEEVLTLQLIEGIFPLKFCFCYKIWYINQGKAVRKSKTKFPEGTAFLDPIRVLGYKITTTGPK